MRVYPIVSDEDQIVREGERKEKNAYLSFISIAFLSQIGISR